MTMTDGIGLYLHIPFCIRKCAYCDFCSYVGREGDMAAYVDRMIEEMQTKPCNRPIGTVYFGGGTPSLLPIGELSRLMEAVYKHYAVSNDAEITCEVNPGTVDRDKLSHIRALGINRLSIGVQSLSDRALRALSRVHTAAEAIGAYRAAREVGFDNISLDLMMGLPGESTEELDATVRGFLALAPEHISAYALMLEEGTPLASSPLRHTVPDEDATADAMERVSAMLAEGGYRRYEISNYARPGYESRHNLGYWRRREYIGLGVAAYSYFDGMRYGTPRDLEGYLAGRPLSAVDRETLGAADREAEHVMLSLRLAEGIDRAAYLAEHGRDPHTLFAPVTARYPEAFSVTEATLALTERGMAVSNTLIAELLLLLDP